MSQLVAEITIGVSASGKSTYAREMCQNHGYVALDRDDLRFSLRKAGNWGEYQFDKKIETIITTAHVAIAKESFHKKLNLVIAETSLSPKSRNKWKKILNDIGYKVVFKEFHISLEDAIYRDAERQYAVGEKVLRDQYKRWNEYLSERYIETNKSLLSLEFLDTLPTPRVLAYFKKYRDAGRSRSFECDNASDQALANYYDSIRELLATREHVEG